MKRLLLFVVALSCVVAVAAEAATDDWVTPLQASSIGCCRFMHGTGSCASWCSDHVGIDYFPVPAGTTGVPIRAISAGYDLIWYGSISSFGGCPKSAKGGALWVKHRKATGQYFWVLYGHVSNPTYTTMPTGRLIQAGEQIAALAHYNPCCPSGDDCPHLHLGVWDSNSAPPTTAMGYGTQRNFVDPDVFRATNAPYGGAAATYLCSPAGNTYHISGHPGDVFANVYVKYKNTGTATWNRTGGLSDPNYVELKPCNYLGVVTDSWFTPYDWLAAQRVTTCDEATVPPSTQTVEHHATFTFGVKIPTNATTTNEDEQVWFRPAQGDVPMENWGGVNILVQVLPPSDPSNLIATPGGCSAANAFVFSWAPSDAGASGVKRYHWNINGVGDNLTAATTVSALAPSVGGHTFSVRAEDNAGNLSGYVQTSFCYQPSTGPCTGREIPHSCVTSTQCYPAASANLLTLPKISPEQWQAVGQPVGELLQPGTTYSIGFEYRSDVSSAVKIGLGSAVVLDETALPSSTKEWRSVWSAPFTVTSDQLANYTSLRFLMSNTTGVEIRNVQVWTQHSP